MRISRLLAAAVLACSVAAPAVAAGGIGGDDPGIHCKPKWQALNDPGDGPVPTIYVPTGGVECW